MMASRPSDPMHLAYLVSKYPAISHTFIEAEIAGLRERGVQVRTYTIRPCPATELLSESMRVEHARTTPLVGAGARTWLAAHAHLLRRAPGVWLGTLGRALRTGRPHPKSRLWQVFYFGEAVVLWHLMDADGLRHVHVHMANVAADVARLTTAIGTGVDGPAWGWSLTIHGPGEFGLLREWDVPAKLLDASAVSCITQYCRRELTALVPAEHHRKFGITHMTIDPARFRPPDEPRRSGGRVRFLYVGRLVPEKGGPVLLEALEMLRERGIAFEARIAGSGPLHDTLAAQAGPGVQLIGPVSQDDLLREYHWADVFVLPSFAEGLPVVLMEAMATGLPVVTTRITGIPELVTGVTGRLVEPGDARALADALAAEAAALGDESVPERREAARAAVLAGFTREQCAPRMVQLLRAAIESRGEIADVAGAQDSGRAGTPT